MQKIEKKSKSILHTEEDFTPILNLQRLESDITNSNRLFAAQSQRT
jgi:hypothetical protein